jgi:hypothetical protein
MQAFMFRSRLVVVGLLVVLLLLVGLVPPHRVFADPLCPRHSKGDANCDGSVDDGDYAIWVHSQCHPDPGQVCTDLRADFNDDGAIDYADYRIWSRNRGTQARVTTVKVWVAHTHDTGNADFVPGESMHFYAELVNSGNVEAANTELRWQVTNHLGHKIRELSSHEVRDVPPGPLTAQHEVTLPTTLECGEFTLTAASSYSGIRSYHETRFKTSGKGCNQPIEYIPYQSGPVYRLHNGRLVEDCQGRGDTSKQAWKVDIDLNVSYDPEKLRIGSTDDGVYDVFHDAAPMGVDLSTAQPALCLSQLDVEDAGGIGDVMKYLFVWVSP